VSRQMVAKGRMPNHHAKGKNVQHVMIGFFNLLFHNRRGQGIHYGRSGFTPIAQIGLGEFHPFIRGPDQDFAVGQIGRGRPNERRGHLFTPSSPTSGIKGNGSRGGRIVEADTVLEAVQESGQESQNQIDPITNVKDVAIGHDDCLLLTILVGDGRRSSLASGRWRSCSC
jgi:hypothetical protein